jgi:SAM-dependent methyltransferase
MAGGRIVDVGCSTGLLVRMLQDAGYDAQGIEHNPESAGWGRSHYGVPIHSLPLEQCPFPRGSLDAVVLTDVLEHTLHPREFLRTLGETLAPGGLVLVAFPDIRSLESRSLRALARVARREWIWNTCHVPLHVWEFTPATARRCFEQAGFRVLELRRSQPTAERGLPGWLGLITFPLRALELPMLARYLGTQMEFVIQKVPSLIEGANVPRPIIQTRVGTHTMDHAPGR